MSAQWPAPAGREWPQPDGETDAQRERLGVNGYLIDTKSAALPDANARPLGQAPRGYAGRICAIAVMDMQSALPAAEIERRLIELGFIEGALVEILHEGIFGRDPIAVRVNGSTVALRRREAMSILVA